MQETCRDCFLIITYYIRILYNKAKKGGSLVSCQIALYAYKYILKLTKMCKYYKQFVIFLPRSIVLFLDKIYYH